MRGEDKGGGTSESSHNTIERFEAAKPPPFPPSPCHEVSRRCARLAGLLCRTTSLLLRWHRRCSLRALSSRLALRLVSATTARADLISISRCSSSREFARIGVCRCCPVLCERKRNDGALGPLRNCLRALCVSFRKLETKLHQLVIPFDIIR